MAEGIDIPFNSLVVERKIILFDCHRINRNISDKDVVSDISQRDGNQAQYSTCLLFRMTAPLNCKWDGIGQRDPTRLIQAVYFKFTSFSRTGITMHNLSKYHVIVL
jgi:hypothetical protein